MKLIGLTGGIATGKSTVSGMIRSLGVPVIDADVLAREVVEPGSFGLRSIVEIFGRVVLDKGSLDRKVLAAKIFEDEESRLVLERITHPLIQWRARQEFEFLRHQGQRLIFYDAALIFEKNLVDQFDAIVVVHTTGDDQIKRLMQRDRISREEVSRRLKAQWPLSKKIPLAHYTINNSGSVEETKKQVKELVTRLRKEAGLA